MEGDLGTITLLDTTIAIGTWLVFIGVILAFFGLRYKEGLWSNTVCFLNIMFSSIIAIAYFEDLSAFISNSIWAGGIFYWDYVCVMVLFCLSYFLLAVITNRLTAVKSRFPVPVEVAGNYLSLACCVVYFLFFLFTTVPTMPIQYNRDTEIMTPIAQQVEMLSSGSLSGLSGVSVFDSSTFWNRQNGRRAAHQAWREDGKSVYDGSVPPRG